MGLLMKTVHTRVRERFSRRPRVTLNPHTTRFILSERLGRTSSSRRCELVPPVQLQLSRWWSTRKEEPRKFVGLYVGSLLSCTAVQSKSRKDRAGVTLTFRIAWRQVTPQLEDSESNNQAAPRPCASMWHSLESKRAQRSAGTGFPLWDGWARTEGGREGGEVPAPVG